MKYRFENPKITRDEWLWSDVLYIDCYVTENMQGQPIIVKNPFTWDDVIISTPYQRFILRLPPYNIFVDNNHAKTH